MKDSLLAIVTGASSGIGYELALICAREGYELLIAADSPEIEQAASKLRAHGAPAVSQRRRAPASINLSDTATTCFRSWSHDDTRVHRRSPE